MYYNITNSNKDPVGNICQAKINILLPNGSNIIVSANEDPEGSKNLASKHLLHNIKSCIDYSLPPISMTTIHGPSPVYSEVGELHFVDESEVPIVILCYVQEKPIPGHSDFVLISNNTLVDLEADINYQAKASKERGVMPMKRNTTKPYHYIEHTQETNNVSKVNRISFNKKTNTPSYYLNNRCNCKPRIPTSLTRTQFAKITNRRIRRAPKHVQVVCYMSEVQLQKLLDDTQANTLHYCVSRISCTSCR